MAERHSPIRYARITLADGKTFYLQIDSETNRFVRGREVLRDGEEAAGDRFDLRIRIIDRQTIKRMVEARMNLFYGKLETIKVLPQSTRGR